LKYETLELQDKNIAMSKQMKKLENELSLYKDFFVNNEVKVFLKDKEK